jgi:hypothetical protein
VEERVRHAGRELRLLRQRRERRGDDLGDRWFSADGFPFENRTFRVGGGDRVASRLSREPRGGAST